MSEVLESYIRRNPGLTETATFEKFLGEDRIRSWVGEDPTRRERLRKEFTRVWASMHGAPAPPASHAAPSAPLVQPMRTVQVEERRRPSGEDLPVARKLAVLCTSCQRVNVWMRGGDIRCRSCGHTYDDMLQLIRVTPVGPFEFLFGTGWVGYATAGGIAAGLLGLYYLLVRGF